MNNEGKIFCGSGKHIGNFGNIAINLCIDDIPPQFIDVSKNGKRYVNLKVCNKKNIDQYGNSHYVEVNTWKPSPQFEQQTKPQNNNQFNNNQFSNEPF